MQSTLGQAQERAVLRPTPGLPSAVAVSPTAKEIPYDYVAKFTLAGNNAGNRVQDVINISIDGAFVAVAIGYSFIPKVPVPPALPSIPVPSSPIPTSTTL